MKTVSLYEEQLWHEKSIKNLKTKKYKRKKKTSSNTGISEITLTRNDVFCTDTKKRCFLCFTCTSSQAPRLSQSLVQPIHIVFHLSPFFECNI